MGTSTGAYAMLTCKRIAQKRRVNAFRINGDNAASVDPAIAAQNANARYGTHGLMKAAARRRHPRYVVNRLKIPRLFTFKHWQE